MKSAASQWVPQVNLLIPTLFVVVILLALSEAVTSPWLEFDRMAIADGQWWRLLSAHIVHLSITHALGNSGGLLVLAWLLRNDVSDLRLGLLFLWCALVVGGGLYWFAPDLQRYAGLSGVLHGVLLVAPFSTRAYGYWSRLLIALFILSKVLWEQTPFYNDQALMEVIGGRVETRSHLLGVVAGGIWLMVMAVWQRQATAGKGNLS